MKYLFPILIILAFSNDLTAQDHPFRVFTPTSHVDNLSRGGGIDTTEKIVTVEATPMVKISTIVIKSSFPSRVYAFRYQRQGEEWRIFEGSLKGAKMVMEYLKGERSSLTVPRNNSIQTYTLEEGGDVSLLIRCRCEK